MRSAASRCPKVCATAIGSSKPLFTPSTKASSGHDENISFDEGAAVVGADLMRWLGDTTLDLYTRASAYALQRGIILADTKFEFGQIAGDGTPLLVDEIFTPDSSRFWPADLWRPGAEQPSFDKQYVRDYLETLVSARPVEQDAAGSDVAGRGRAKQPRAIPARHSSA